MIPAKPISVLGATGSIGASTLATLVMQGTPLAVVPQQMFQGINTFALVAVPMFILTGDLMAQGAVSRKLVDFAPAGEVVARFFFIADPDGYQIEVLQRGGRFK